ncbi:hypothetical protein C1X05_12400 [Laceyella sacchari]|uniref:hypothetical protein n=1 Tax=Laceyella tengchongensis TaxID=574699 RepID=UPI000C9F7CFA|nr:hypothetical protein [Laceyella tengchongensis]AUS09538.1 hypothetical protein C1X05_12400 [Laceyella sacchari]
MAFKKALNAEQGTLLKTQLGNRGIFKAIVKLKNNIELEIEGWFKELADGTKEITSHCPAYDRKNPPNWTDLGPNDW